MPRATPKEQLGEDKGFKELTPYLQGEMFVGQDVARETLECCPSRSNTHPDLCLQVMLLREVGSKVFILGNNVQQSLRSITEATNLTSSKIVKFATLF